jgi:hypothetical protein
MIKYSGACLQERYFLSVTQDYKVQSTEQFIAWSMNLIQIIYKNSVRTAKKTPHFTIT